MNLWWKQAITMLMSRSSSTLEIALTTTIIMRTKESQWSKPQRNLTQLILLITYSPLRNKKAILLTITQRLTTTRGLSHQQLFLVFKRRSCFSRNMNHLCAPIAWSKLHKNSMKNVNGKEKSAALFISESQASKLTHSKINFRLVRSWRENRLGITQVEKIIHSYILEELKAKTCNSMGTTITTTLRTNRKVTTSFSTRSIIKHRWKGSWQ